MKIQHSTVKKMVLTELERLDPVAVIAEDIGPAQGKITITCFGKSWTGYWSGMGERNIQQFFLSCDNSYLMGCIAPHIDDDVLNTDAFRSLIESKGIDCSRDDPWNDYEIMAKLFGDDMAEWSDMSPKMKNPEYQYICRIIDAVKAGFEQNNVSKTAA